MGTLFRITCDHCDTKTNVTFDGFVGAALTEFDKPGEIVSDGYVAYLSPQGKLVVLPHPLESSSLAAAGGSWNRSSLSGRLLRFTNLICLDCGALNKTARIHSAGPGCTLMVPMGIATFVLGDWLLPLPTWIMFTLSWVAAAIPPWIEGTYVNMVHGENAAPYRFQHCVQCGGSKAIPLSDSLKKKLPCPKCGERTISISYAGKS